MPSAQTAHLFIFLPNATAIAKKNKRAVFLPLRSPNFIDKIM